MAIEENITAGNQMNLYRWSCSTEANVITLTPPSIERDFCLCHYEPSYCEFAFYDLLDSSDEYKNDYKKVLLNPKSLTSTTSITLETPNNGEITVDATISEVYAQGFNVEQTLQLGVKIQWVRVANLYGAGEYKIKTSVTDFGNEVTTESHIFNVVPFSVDRANSTVKIEIVNKGVTMNGDDYSGHEEFVNMIRVDGMMSYTGEEMEIDTLIDSNREHINVQKTTRGSYELQVNDLPYKILNPVLSNGIFMDWMVTDYNVFNFGDFRKLDLTIEDSINIDKIQNYSKRFVSIPLKSTQNKTNRKFV